MLKAITAFGFRQYALLGRRFFPLGFNCLHNTNDPAAHKLKDFRIGATTTKVLKGVSLKLLQGEFVSIMGQSGSGKSKLLYILGGLDTPTGGSVHINGTNISKWGDEKMKEYKKQLNHILNVVGLSDRRKHTPRELSGGQKRAAIARALITNPEILFADEPTGNLDSQTGAEIMSLLQEINEKSGQTIVMVTHSPEAAKCSSRIITVMDGIIA